MHHNATQHNATQHHARATYPEDDHGLVGDLLRGRSGRIHVHSLQNTYKHGSKRTFTGLREQGNERGEMHHVVE